MSQNRGIGPTDRTGLRILQVTAFPFPPEIREAKEGLSLLNAGYQSAVLCPPMRGRPARETWRGLHVFRPQSLDAAGTMVDKVIYHTAFLSPAWLRAVRQVLAEYRPHAIHIHDIWLARTVLLARGDERIVLDLGENMPAAVVEYARGVSGLRRIMLSVFKTARRVGRYEGHVLRRSDLVFVVVQEANDRVRSAHPDLPPERLHTVENLESRDFLCSPPIDRRLIEDDHFSILYIGGFAPHRGIETLIRAMRHLKAWGANARLHLVGAKEGSYYLSALQALIAGLDLSSYVELVGWVPSESVLTYVRQASLGAVPHESNPHTDTTIPHKLFQYMIAATPVLVSSSPPLARTVRSAEAGAVFTAGDDLDCATRIAEMIRNPQQLEAYGKNGFRYVTQLGHNWEAESGPRLIAAYDRLFGIRAESAVSG